MDIGGDRRHIGGAQRRDRETAAHDIGRVGDSEIFITAAAHILLQHVIELRGVHAEGLLQGVVH